MGWEGDDMFEVKHEVYVEKFCDFWVDFFVERMVGILIEDVVLI